MHNLKKNNNNLIDHDNNGRFPNPSFSSTLLDQIYRSIDQGDSTKSPEMKFYRQRTTTEKKQNHKRTETTIMDNNRRRDNNNVAVGVVGTEKMDRRRRSRDYDHDVMFFSSASFSSDSSSSFSGGLSSSDTESLYGTRSLASSSCLPPLRPKPVRTSMSCRYEEQGGDRRFHSFRHGSNAELGVSIGDADEALLIKSKSRALKIYNNLKKVKQPISPGGKITSFLNSIFTSSKKTRSTIKNTNNTNTISTTTKLCSTIGGRLHGSDDVILFCKDAKNGESRAKSIQVSTCSSASSFSRSCLSKTNSCDRDKLCNGVKRTVRFYPLSVVVGEDCRPCGHKRVCEEEGKAAKASKSSTKNNVVEKRRVVEEAAREFLEKYHRNKKKNDLVLKDLNLPISTKINANEDDDDNDDDDDDGASCASSDLFELDHLAVFGNGRYCEELPVYETTHVSTNHAIANGLISSFQY